MLIDGNSLQGKVHLVGTPKRCKIKVKPGERFKDFINIAKLVKKDLVQKFVEPGKKYKKKHFLATSLVVIPTREKTELNSRELKLVTDFVWSGGSLLLMSNHNPYSSPNSNLARAFDIELLNAFFFDHNGYTSLENALLNKRHPVIKGINPPQTTVKSIVTNTCDAVTAGNGNIAAWLPEAMDDRLELKMSSTGTAFGITKEWGQGRILVVTDSGLFGNVDTNYPGPGLLDKGDNRQFLLNSLYWLFRVDQDILDVKGFC